jgi:hypothetical protein
VGTFSTSVGARSCCLCKPGTFKPHTGSNYSCSACRGGNYQSARSASSCIACAAGTFSTGLGATACAHAPPVDCFGTPDGTAAVGCDGVCGSGLVVGGCDKRCGSTAVDGCDGVCGSGKVVGGCDRACGSTKAPGCDGRCGTPPCADCPVGTYRNGTDGTGGCAPCPDGRTSPAGSRRPADCVCKPGYIRGPFDTCNPCPEGGTCSTDDPSAVWCVGGTFLLVQDYPPAHVVAQCYPCPSGTTTSMGSRKMSDCRWVKCPLGYYKFGWMPGCEPCAPVPDGGADPACVDWAGTVARECGPGGGCGAGGCRIDCGALCPAGSWGQPGPGIRVFGVPAVPCAACPPGTDSRLGIYECK